MLGSLHGIDTDAADTEDGDDVAGLGFRGVHSRAPAGGHAAADQYCLIEGDVVVDLDHRVLVDHVVLAESAEGAHRAVASSGPADRPARAFEVALEHGGVHVADGATPGCAVLAPATGGGERADDVVARLDPGDARPDFLDDSRTLVAENHRETGDGIADGDVDVGVTQAAVEVLDQHLVGAGLFERELFDLDGLSWLDDDSCESFHIGSFGWPRPLPGGSDSEVCSGSVRRQRVCAVEAVGRVSTRRV